MLATQFLPLFKRLSHRLPYSALHTEVRNFVPNCVRQLVLVLLKQRSLDQALRLSGGVVHKPHRPRYISVVLQVPVLSSGDCTEVVCEGVGLFMVDFGGAVGRREVFDFSVIYFLSGGLRRRICSKTRVRLDEQW